MIDPIYPLTDGHKAIPLEKAREMVERLREMCREANVSVVIPRQTPSPSRLDFPPGVDMIFGIYSPRADDSDTTIEMHILKSREPKAPELAYGTTVDCCEDGSKAVRWVKDGHGRGEDGWAIQVAGRGSMGVSFCPFCGLRL